MTTYTNPGWIPDVPPTPNDIESTWGNAMRDRLINNFATTTDRDAAITAPVEGQFCYVKGLGLIQYAGPVCGWTRPWYGPWGKRTSASTTANSAAFGTSAGDVAGLAATFTAVVNREYRVLFTGETQSTVAGDQIRLSIADGSAATLITRDIYISANSGRASVYFEADVVGLPNGAYTVKIQAQRVAGSGSCILVGSSTFINRLLVEDIGPNGDPS